MSPYYSELRAALGTRLLIIPGVAALIRNSSGDLLLQRKNDGTWSLPAGAIEPGETPEEALRREILEETGHNLLECRLAGAFGGEKFRFVYPNGHQVENVVLVFDCVTSPNPQTNLDPETVELRFFNHADFPGLQLPYPLHLLFPRCPGV